MLKTMPVAACLALPFAVSAAEEKKRMPQQQKTADGNRQATEKNLDDDERKAFLPTCLSAKA